MLNRKSRCNGLCVNPNPYSEKELKLLWEVLPSVRRQFLEDCKFPERFQGEVLVGSRTVNDREVELTLRSAATAEQFNREPFTWVYDALQDCAERDWHYAMDKRWL